jgi:hypothetical protein
MRELKVYMMTLALVHMGESMSRRGCEKTSQRRSGVLILLIYESHPSTKLKLYVLGHTRHLLLLPELLRHYKLFSFRTDEAQQEPHLTRV